MFLKVFSFLAVGILVSACGIYKTKGANANSESTNLTANPSTQITYAEVNQLVISQSCLTCHGAANPRAGVELTSYTLVNSYIQAMKSDIDSGDMPLTGSLSSAQISLFDQWYAQGAKEF
jgi:hypothetical protein